MFLAGPAGGVHLPRPIYIHIYIYITYQRIQNNIINNNKQHITIIIIMIMSIIIILILCSPKGRPAAAARGKRASRPRVLDYSTTCVIRVYNHIIIMLCYYISYIIPSIS